MGSARASNKASRLQKRLEKRLTSHGNCLQLAEYFGVSVANFEKQMEINVVALKKGLRAWTRKFLRLQASCSKECFHRVSALESENP